MKETFSALKPEQKSLWCLPTNNEMSLMLYKAFKDAKKED